MTITFFVAGVPVPQGSTRAFVVNGRAGVRNGDKPLMEEDIKSTTVVDLPVPTHEATEAYERSLQ